jgi:hypothetical protein
MTSHVRHFFRSGAAAIWLLAFPAWAGAFCTGDCNNDRNVTVDELIMSVGITMGEAGTSLNQCPNLDRTSDGDSSISEVVSAINVALKGCEVVEPFAVIQEVFSQSCAFSSCHSAESRQANLVLSDEELSWANLVLQDPTNPEAFAMGLRRVVPGSPERSYLIRKLKGLGPGDGMPLALPQLPENVIHIIEDWIRRGAPTTEDECTPLPATSGGGSHSGHDDATDCEGRTPLPVGNFEWKPLPALDAPAADEGIQLYTPPRMVEPGTEWETCFAFRVDPAAIQAATGSLAIEKQVYRMHQGSHHLLLYMYLGPNPDGYNFDGYWPCFAGNCDNSGDCPRDSGGLLIPIGGTQVAGTAYEVDYPEGVGIPLIGSVIVANLHYQNPFLPRQQIYGESWINLYFYGAGEHKVILDGVFAINAQDLLVEPYTERTITRIWRPRGLITGGAPDAAVFQLFGHMHKRATEFTIHFVTEGCDFDAFRRNPSLEAHPGCTGTQIYRTTSWDNAPVTDYEYPYLRVRAEEGLRWTCTHVNGRRIAEPQDDGSIVLVDDPLYPPKKCHAGCASCGWDEKSRTCIFTRDRSGRVYQEGDPMPLVFGELADDDMCNMFGYFITVESVCLIFPDAPECRRS